MPQTVRPELAASIPPGRPVRRRVHDHSDLTGRALPAPCPPPALGAGRRARKGESSIAPSHRLQRLALAALAADALVLWLLLWRFAHTSRSLDVRALQLLLFFAAFAAFLLGVCVVRRLQSRLAVRVVPLIVAAGVAFRLTVAPIRPVTSSDVYRYLWEGRVVRAGLNPYGDPPSSPRLTHLRDRLWPLVQHKTVSAAYPPMAQYVFALAGSLPGSRVLMLKLLLAAFDIGTVLLLPGLLRQLGRPPAWALLYAWHPLAVGEVVARGHLDSIGIFFLVLSVRLLISTSPAGRALSGASLAASMLSKGYAVLALPYLLLVAARRRLWFVLGLLVTVASAYLPFLSAGSGLFRGLAAYAGTWRGNASVFALIEWLLPVPRRVGLARLLCGLLLAAWVLSALLRQRRVGAERLLVATDSCFSALAALLLLSPVVYPWYLAWTIPFLCLHVRWGWLALTGTVFAFYAHDFAGHHAEIWWVTVVEYTLPMATAVGAALLGHAHSDQQARQGMSSRPPNRSRRTPRAILPPWEIHSDYRD